MIDPTRELTLLAGLRRTVSRPEIVIQRLAHDLATHTVEGDPDGLNGVGCLYDSGAGRCDGAYKHKGKLHYRVEGDEIWESPW